MIALAGFLASVLHGLALIGLAAATGGLVFVLTVLRPIVTDPALRATATTRALRWMAGGALFMAANRIVGLLLAPWALADEFGLWPLSTYMETGFARATVVSIALALLFAALARAQSRRGDDARTWGPLVLAATCLFVAGAWLTHGTSRLSDAGLLMTATVAHQVGAAVWVGGILNLLLVRRAALDYSADQLLWARLLARFSPVAMVATGTILAAGIVLAWRYVGSWASVVGTSYGIMMLAKIGLFGTALGLAALNLAATRRAIAGVESGAVRKFVPAYVEAEFSIVLVVLLAAAALAAQPPAVDLSGDRATLAEVLGTLAPKVPQLVPPPHDALMADTSPALDFYNGPTATDRLMSNFNHNVAGMFVLLIGLGALLDRIRPRRWTRHWPLLFLPFSLVLLIIAEPTGWPMGDEGFFETLASPGVLQHRMATLLVAVLGLAEWQVTTGRLRGTRGVFAFPALCVVGGAMLLTHTHAQFGAKIDFLIEISHSLIGVLAVLMGTGRWLELRMPADRRRLPGLAWTACFAAVGFVLITYREEVPAAVPDPVAVLAPPAAAVADTAAP
ncbi:MAG: CopD family protein [Gammaproteobacteria bacterium]